MESYNFYCAREAGTFFKIKEWNERYAIVSKLGLSTEEEDMILGTSKCSEQCIDCACIVGDRMNKTKKLIAKNYEKT